MLRRLIAIHQNLLVDDVTLALDFRGREFALHVYVRENFAQLRQMLCPSLCIVAGMIFARECIDIATETLDMLGDLARVPLGRALEKQVLDKVRHTALLCGFMAASNPGP